MMYLFRSGTQVGFQDFVEILQYGAAAVGGSDATAVGDDQYFKGRRLDNGRLLFGGWPNMKTSPVFREVVCQVS